LFFAYVLFQFFNIAHLSGPQILLIALFLLFPPVTPC